MTEDNDWLIEPAAEVDRVARQAAELRQASLTKPPGALGRLEETAVRLAELQGTERPSVDRVSIAVFVGDHGVVAEHVSAFPQAVTCGMIQNFIRGGAAINVLARALDAELKVINLGTVTDAENSGGVLNLNLGPGTANICRAPAMREDQLFDALNAGRQVVENLKRQAVQLFIGGEMGIGNTTSAAALACVLLDAPAEQLAGPGTGLDAQGVSHKCEVIRQALQRHQPTIESPLDALRCLGGFEIAALAGSYLTCAQIGLPALIDGFISSVAALAVTSLCPDAGRWFIYSHRSAEPGHVAILKKLGAQPLLDLGMRLGEGSGAASTVPLLRLACTMHNNMATFSEAAIPGSGL